MKTWLRLTLIAMTVGGCFTGIALTFQALQTPRNRDLPNLEMLALLFALYTYVIGSGLVFVYDPQRTRPMMVALAMQIPRISSPLIIYKFCAGFEAFFDVKIAPPDPRFEWQLFFGSRAQFAMLGEAPWSVGVNILALTMLLLLWKVVRASNLAVLELARGTGHCEVIVSGNPTTLVTTRSGEYVEESPTGTPPDSDVPAGKLISC